MGTTDPLRMAVRVVAALAVLGGGLIHLKLYGDSYRHIDTVGPMFLLNGITSIVLAVTLVVWRHWLVTLAAPGPRQRLTAGVRHQPYRPRHLQLQRARLQPVSVRGVGARLRNRRGRVLLVVLLAWDLSSPEGQAMPLEWQDGSIEASNRVASTHELRSAPPSPLALRAVVAEGTSFDVRTLDSGRTVVWVEVGGERASGFRGVPLSAATSEMVVAGADAARRDGLPLVVVMASTGADIVEGVAALEGRGRMARGLVECSGIVPTVVVVDGPAVSGPALLLGVADLVVMTESSYAVRQRPGDGGGVHRGGHLRRRARWQRQPGAEHRRAHRRRRRPRRCVVDAVDQLLGHLPDSSDSEPPRTDSDDPVDRA